MFQQSAARSPCDSRRRRYPALEGGWSRRSLCRSWCCYPTKLSKEQKELLEKLAVSVVIIPTPKKVASLIRSSVIRSGKNCKKESLFALFLYLPIYRKPFLQNPGQIRPSFSRCSGSGRIYPPWIVPVYLSGLASSQGFYESGRYLEKAHRSRVKMMTFGRTKKTFYQRRIFHRTSICFRDVFPCSLPHKSHRIARP